mmetsp:Transcript_4551/g.10545  ORF Transcript_4551/g.10545 Transcript_4551/m.10545 type:complete len:195 (+) Transcript_4551:56-640(+)
MGEDPKRRVADPEGPTLELLRTFGVSSGSNYYDRYIRGKFLRLESVKLPAAPPKGRNPVGGSKEARSAKHWQSLRDDDFEALRSLWVQYIQDLAPASDEEFASALARADLHGSRLRVVQAKNPGLVRLSGTVIEETSKTFRIITVKNEVKVLPKQNCVFEVEILGRCVRLLGPAYEGRWAPGAPGPSGLRRWAL